MAVVAAFVVVVFVAAAAAVVAIVVVVAAEHVRSQVAHTFLENMAAADTRAVAGSPSAEYTHALPDT